MFRPAFGCAKHPKAGQNTQQMYTKSVLCVWFQDHRPIQSLDIIGTNH